MSKKEREFPFYVNSSGSMFYNANYSNKPRHVFDLSKGEDFRAHVIRQLGNYGSDSYPLVRGSKPVSDYAHNLYQAMEVPIGKISHLYGSFAMMKFLNHEGGGILTLEPKIAVLDENHKIAKIIKPDIVLENGRNCIVEVQGDSKFSKRKVDEISRYCGMIDDAELIVAFPDYTQNGKDKEKYWQVNFC